MMNARIKSAHDGSSFDIRAKDASAGAAGAFRAGHESVTEAAHSPVQAIGCPVLPPDASPTDPEHCQVTPNRGLKRLGFGLAAVVAAGVGAIVAVPYLVRADAVREAVKSEIRFVTGLEPVSLGEVSIATFPSGSASFSNVVLGGDATNVSAANGKPPGQPPLAAERLVAQLRFLPLLFGRVEVAEVTLIRPRIVLDFDDGGKSNWAGLFDTLTRTLKPAGRSGRTLSFSEIRLVDGTVSLFDRSRGMAETVRGIELSLAWPSISKSFTATGQMIWRGETLDASATLSDFLAALTGERSGLKLRVTGAPLKFAFDGSMSHKPMLKFDGTVAADGPSLRQALRWMGHRPPPGGGLKRFSLKGQASLTGHTASLSGVNVDLDGNVAEGSLVLNAEQRPLLQGTLAADDIDITPYLSTIRLLAANERDWDRVPILLDGLAGTDIDLRLSAARMTMSGSKIGRTALAANLRSGKLVLTIGESQAFGGMLKGSLGITKTNPGAEVRTALQFTNVDLEACIGAVFGIRRIEGRGNLAIALEASGNDVFALAHTVNGSATLLALDGAVTGLNVEQLLRRLERRPLSGGGDFRNGRTPFDKLGITLKITDGTASVEDVKLEGAAVRLNLDGSASIPARDLDLKGVATLVSTSAKEPAPPSFELPFVVRGHWEDPVMLPDAQSLIRRSGAAAPLLDAVRGGRARDAVRSAIEQMTRGAEPPQVVAPAPASARPVAGATP